MKCSLLIFISLMCGAFAGVTTSKDPTYSDLRSLDTISSTKLLVLDLLRNLRNAGEQALTAVSDFRIGLQDQAVIFQAKLTKDLENIRSRIQNAIKLVSERFIAAGVGVRKCIEEGSGDAEILISETFENIKDCGRERFKDVSTMIEELSTLASNSTEFASSISSQISSCLENNGLNVLATGSCLTEATLQAEREAAIFIYEFGVAVARISLSLATLPAALEVCVGSQLVEVGRSTARILIQIGQCSVSSLYSIISTNDLKFIDHSFV